MGTEAFRKRGKKDTNPGKVAAQIKEEIGNPYYFRHEFGSDRTGELYENYYGKKAAPEPEQPKGIMVSPRKTQLRG